MDVRQLRVFAQVARRGSFTRAAEDLHIAQPAVSIAVRKLEDELEHILLNRQDKRVTLTAEGEALLVHARRILDDFSAAEEEMAELRGLGSGEVRIGITPMMSAYYFPRIIMQFREQYPNLQLSVNGEGAASIQKMIFQGEIDMGVITGQKVQEGLEYQHFLREEIVACVPVSHRFAKSPALAMEDFLQQPQIVFKQGYYMRELLNQLLKEEGQAPEIVFETNLFSLVRSLVSEGMGVSTLLRMAVGEDTDIAAVSFDPPLYLDLVIAWKKNRYLSRANRAFIEFLITHAGDSQNK